MRILVPIIALIIGTFFVLGMLNKPDMPKTDPASDLQQVQTADPSTDQAKPSTDSLVEQVKTTVKAISDPPAVVTDLPVMHVVAADQAVVSTLGSLDTESDAKLQVEISGWGAGLYHVQLTDYRKDLNGEEHYTIQKVIEDNSKPGAYYFPFAARQITVNGQTLKLSDKRWNLDPTTPGKYSVDLADEVGDVLVTLIRHYSIDGYQIACAQQIINHTHSQLNVVWDQYGITDATPDKASYMGDRRMMVTGYYDPKYDSTRQFIYADKSFVERKKITQNILDNQINKAQGKPLEPSAFWPAPKAPENAQMVWAASVNRYFAMAMYPPLSLNDGTMPLPLLGTDGIFASVNETVVGIPSFDRKAADTSKILLTMTSKPIIIEAGKSANIDMNLYAGPRLQDILSGKPFVDYSLYEVIRYELGCTWCTFQWLAQGLLNFLKFLHSIVWDWGISIIILVLCVRALLHPITKKSQINMTKMGKQMQSIQPEVKKLKEKYANDQQKFQQEQMKLYREKNINPANMLGCAPMFMQTPIWIALYAMLYFAIELRHESGFYGVFQWISGGSWSFLADLSAPDNFIQFSGTGFSIPLPFINFHLTGLNILPLLMGVMFFFQQKLTMPPAATEQAAQQQKMMKFMTLLFPFFLYSAPSGLTLYILSSTTAGMVDSYLVRKHIKEQEASGELFKSKPRKEGGIMDRISKMMQAKMEDAQRQNQKKLQNKNKKRK